MRKNCTISLMVSGKRMFNEHKDIYKRILDENLTIKGILLTRNNSVDKDAKEMKKNHGTKLNYVFALTQGNTTCRRFVVNDAFALDGRKLLPSSKQEPSYLGTIYFDQESIARITEIFNDTWTAGEIVC